MKGDKKVLDYLNRALRAELTAITQYWLHGRLQEDWGLLRMSAKSLAESEEERGHANRLIGRILLLGGVPDMQTLDPLRVGASARETLECDLKGEEDAIALYTEAREVCEKAGDYVSKNLFEDLLADEQGHADFLETQIDLHDRMGAERYNELNASPIDEAA